MAGLVDLFWGDKDTIENITLNPIFMQLFCLFQSCVVVILRISFRDVIMEAKANETLVWTCDFCSVLVPHMHVHKVILASSCDYLHGLFYSGMMERCFHFFLLFFFHI